MANDDGRFGVADRAVAACPNCDGPEHPCDWCYFETDPTDSHDKEAAAKLERWFFRDCNPGTRRQLFSIFEMPVHEITNQHYERIAFHSILISLVRSVRGAA